MAETNLKTIRAGIIRQKLADRKSDAFIVSNPANVTYMTGFMGDDSWAMIAGRTVYLITDSRYAEQAVSECSGCKITERKGPMAEAVARLLEKHKTVETIAVENSISIAQLKTLKKKIKKKITPVENLIEDVRRTKNTDEISAIRKAAKVAHLALATAKKSLRPDVTESEFAGRIELEMRKLGARNSFDTIVAFGANASRPHHLSGKTKLKKNDSVLIDFGVKLDGYCSDITRCFAVGKPSRLFTKAYQAVAEAHDTAVEAVKSGVDLKEIDAITRKVIEQHAFESHGHGTGHGLGLEVHELPFIGPKSKGKLKTGDIITIEPGIYIPGKLGIRIEDDILVTKDGFKILSGGL